MNQSRIPVPAHNPPTAEGHGCDWCPQPATVVKEMQKKSGKGAIGRQMYLYACYRHEHLAREGAQPK
jgi:hypothetical protein